MFILAKLQNKDLKLESFIQIIRRKVVGKAKKHLQFWATTKNIDQHYF